MGGEELEDKSLQSGSAELGEGLYNLLSVVKFILHTACDGVKKVKPSKLKRNLGLNFSGIFTRMYFTCYRPTRF